MKLLCVLVALVALALPAFADQYDYVGAPKQGRLKWPDGGVRGGFGYKYAHIDIRYAYMVCDRTLYVAVEYGSELYYSAQSFYVDREAHDTRSGFDIEPDLEDEITFEAYGLTAGTAYRDTTFSCSDDRKSIVNVGWLVDVGHPHDGIDDMRLDGVTAALPLENEALRDEIEKRKLDAIKNGSSSYSGSSYSGSSYSGSSSSSGTSSSSSTPTPTTTSGGAGQAVGAIGGLSGAALVGTAASDSGSDSDSDMYDPLEYSRPRKGMPILGILEVGGVGIGLYFVFGYGMNASLEKRIIDKGLDPTTHRKLDWSAGGLLGPTFAYTFNAGYAREHRSGMLGGTLPIDTTMSGFALDLAFRFQMFRFNAGYQHLRGDLIDGRVAGQPEKQAVDSFSTGAALQLGWHQLFSPYVGMRYRVDLQNGRSELVRPHLIGGRTLGTLGLSINFPPARHLVMFRSFTLNIESYRALDDANIDSGLIVSAGMGAWLPASVGAIKGMTGYDNVKTGAYGSWLVPYIFSGGAGLEIVSIDSGHNAVTAVDGWIKTNIADDKADAGVALGAWGYRQSLGGVHSVAFKATPFAVSRWTRDEELGLSEVDPTKGIDGEAYDRGKLKIYAFGQLRFEYHAVIRSHLAELGVRMPLFWWTNRATNTFAFGDMKMFDGSPPMMLFAGFGF